MTDVKIDPATGLPELPEGYFWRVGAPHHSLMWGAYKSGVEIMEETYGPWREFKRNGVYTGHVMPDKYPDKYEFRAVFQTVRERTWYGGFRHRNDVVSEHREIIGRGAFQLSREDTPYERVTRDTLFEVAKETYLAWQERLRELREWDDLQGDYPPKSVKGAPVGETD